ncbi:enoyl-[acyl-carrier protein] reductase I [Methylohalomonas lacus]|uniref:Enoyl-[acyl-carrier-protein] reductase [NADH] n=1 Tax=Methylohalomonas lacus TaxID=398773 RepID=A0AAE3HLP9_9GAMM|nr:enoyl-ACP reductase FabI [Methylohalomonas lacus]MCS3902717.1 enoyl-[acyl-carrier protein] reductase I [Methylohalomonas lacus]
MTRFDLSNKKGLIVGIANEQSLAYGSAQAIREQGGRLAITYLNDKARPHVEPLANELGSELFLPCNVTRPDEVDAVFTQIREHWGGLDFLIHSIAYAPLADLQGRLIDSSRDGFLEAMDISCHSLMRLAKQAEPLMKDGGSILTMSYIGAERAVANYNLMGPVKAALESAVRYLAHELGPRDIRVNAISAGPVATRAASGLADFEKLIERANQHAPLNRPLSVADVGSLAAFLVADGAYSITGETLHVDGGYHARD